VRACCLSGLPSASADLHSVPEHDLLTQSEAPIKNPAVLILIRTRMVVVAQAMQSALGERLPAQWVFVMRSAPVGKKAESKRKVEDLGERIVIRDKSAPRAAAPRGAGGPAGRAAVPVSLEGSGGVGTTLTSITIDTSATLEVARLAICAAAPHATSAVSLPPEWIFVRNGAPVGVKQEKKVLVQDCMPVLLVRPKVARRSTAAAARAPPTPQTQRSTASATEATMVPRVRPASQPSRLHVAWELRLKVARSLRTAGRVQCRHGEGCVSSVVAVCSGVFNVSRSLACG
jgi:hypothetical protein